jgi:rRNA-processing protein FCF1
MRNAVTRTFESDGKTSNVTILDDPNIDDLVVAQAEIQAYVVATSDTSAVERVSRGVREIFLRFGVQR